MGIHQEKFSQNLTALMRARGITLSHAAKKTAISKATLHNYCQGIVPKHIDTLVRLAEFFAVSLDELVLGEIKSPVDNPSLVGKYVLTIESLKNNDGKDG